MPDEPTYLRTSPDGLAPSLEPMCGRLRVDIPQPRFIEVTPDPRQLPTNRRARAILSLGLAFLLPLRSVCAQQSASEIAQSRDEIATLTAAMKERRVDAAEIEQRLADANPIMLEILRIRLENDRIELMQLGLRLGEVVASLPDETRSGPLVQMAVDVLRGNLELADSAWESLDVRTVVPSENLEPVAQAEVDRSFFAIQRNKDRVLALTAETLALLRNFDADVAAAQAAFEKRLRERAINASVYLDMALEGADTLRAGLQAVPGDTELKVRLAEANSRVSRIADTLGNVADQLDAVGIDTSSYRAQLLRTTGQITPAVFSLSVIRNIASRVNQALKDWVARNGPNLLFRAFVFLIIVFIFSRLSRIVRRAARGSLDRSRGATSALLQRTLVSVAGNIVLGAGILIALSQLGVSVGALLAGLGIAGFVIGFALQDTLSNFASGLMILFYRPFDVGNVVEVGGVTGKVGRMTLVNTTVDTFDNQTIIVPNKMIWGNVIRNVTAKETRRVDMTFAISYRDDIEKTERILRELVTKHPKVLADPEPTIRLHELGDSSVKFIVRPWTPTESYWEVYWDLTRAVKLRFDQEGISIPFPQRDVHVIGARAARSLTAAAAGEALPANPDPRTNKS